MTQVSKHSKHSSFSSKWFAIFGVTRYCYVV